MPTEAISQSVVTNRYITPATSGPHMGHEAPAVVVVLLMGVHYGATPKTAQTASRPKVAQYGTTAPLHECLCPDPPPSHRRCLTHVLLYVAPVHVCRP